MDQGASGGSGGKHVLVWACSFLHAMDVWRKGQDLQTDPQKVNRMKNAKHWGEPIGNWSHTKMSAVSTSFSQSHDFLGTLSLFISLLQCDVQTCS